MLRLLKTALFRWKCYKKNILILYCNIKGKYFLHKKQPCNSLRRGLTFFLSCILDYLFFWTRSASSCFTSSPFFNQSICEKKIEFAKKSFYHPSLLKLIRYNSLMNSTFSQMFFSLSKVLFFQKIIYFFFNIFNVKERVNQSGNLKSSRFR